MRGRNRWYALPYLLWVAIFTVAPMGLLLYYAFTKGGSGFTLVNFQKFLDPTYIKVLGRSLWLALLCTAVCLALGYPISYLLARHKHGNLLSMLFILPMWMNFLLRTYAWMSLLENTGLVNRLLGALGFGQLTLLYNSGAVLLGMVYNFLPFMILPIYNSLQRMDRSLIEAAGDLGANPIGVFRRVTLPLSLPGIMSGITMVFMPAVTTFVISRLLGGSHFMLFGDLIEQQFLQASNWNFGSALSVIMMVLILLGMGLLNRVGSNGNAEGRTIM
ncbi:MAG: ABC transporter permease [Eubacteriales bacterium]|nr:ABC transporter permease [Eubacteriales bacterium]